MNKKIKNIIFVDDDQIIGLVTKRLLDQMQLAEEVIVFNDSLKALQFLRDKYKHTSASQPTDSADLILLDIEMPGFGGFEILYILNELKRAEHISLKNTCFAIVTSHKTAKEVELAGRHDITTVLEKPLKQKDILDLVRKIS